MANTIVSVNEARSLVDQLIDKTANKKLEWTEDDENDFTTSIPGGFVFTIYESEEARRGFGFLMEDEGGVEILRVDVESSPRYGYSLQGEKELAQALARLHELARRDALEVDQKVNRAKSLLLAL